MKPYLRKKVRKTKTGYSASVYILARAEGKTRKQALDRLSKQVWEMECRNKDCCAPRVWTASNANAYQFLVSTGN